MSDQGEYTMKLIFLDIDGVINGCRFRMSQQLVQIFENTAREELP